VILRPQTVDRMQLPNLRIAVLNRWSLTRISVENPTEFGSLPAQSISLTGK
jgi:hypothetical protein